MPNLSFGSDEIKKYMIRLFRSDPKDSFVRKNHDGNFNATKFAFGFTARKGDMNSRVAKIWVCVPTRMNYTIALPKSHAELRDNSFGALLNLCDRM